MSLKVTFVVVGNNGGMVHYPANLINAVDNICRVNVISITSGGEELESLVNTSNVTQVTVDPSRIPYNVPKISRELINIVSTLRGIDPDIVHFPFYNNATMGLPPFFSIMGYEVIANIHDPVRKEGLKPRLWRQRQQFDALFMDKILVHGEATANKAIQAGLPSSKIRKIPHGLYTHFQNKPVGDAGEEVLFFGTIRPDKGFGKIPKITEHIHSELDVTVRVAGSLGDDEWGSQILEELRETANVVVDEGYIPNDDVQSYFERAAVVVLPYEEATTSGILLTSYTFNTPVVTTNVGDLGMMVREDASGLVAETKYPESIATRVIDLFKEPDLRENKIENIREKNDKYKWENIAEELDKIYTGL